MNDTAKTPTPKTVLKDTAEKLDQKLQEGKEKVLEKVAESKEKTTTKVEPSANKVTAKATQAEVETQAASAQPLEPVAAEEVAKPATVQDKIAQLKQDLLQRLEDLKGLKGADLSEISAFVKAEFNAVIEDLSKLGKELKQDVSEISLKHKEQLTETLKRSKEHTLEALSKSSKSEAKDDSKPQA